MPNTKLSHAQLLGTGGIMSISASILSSTITDDALWEGSMYTLGLKEAAERLAELIDEVADGEEVVITREDGAAFKIIPVALLPPSPKFGSAKGR